MKVTISNIAWQPENDAEMYAFLKEKKCTGIEIAPTRIFPEKPYSDLEKVADFRDELNANYGLQVVSMQSICYGRNEAIFSSEDERNSLLEYIKQSIDFASVLGCKNLVFGSPKNRNINPNQEEIAAAKMMENTRAAELERSALRAKSAERRGQEAATKARKTKALTGRASGGITKKGGANVNPIYNSY